MKEDDFPRMHLRIVLEVANGFKLYLQFGTKVMGVARVNGDLAVSRAFGDAQHKTTGGAFESISAKTDEVSLPPYSAILNAQFHLKLWKS